MSYLQSIGQKDAIAIKTIHLTTGSIIILNTMGYGSICLQGAIDNGLICKENFNETKFKRTIKFQCFGITESAIQQGIFLDNGRVGVAYFSF